MLATVPARPSVATKGFTNFRPRLTPSNVTGRPAEHGGKPEVATRRSW
jgi:hypothetical protein